MSLRAKEQIEQDGLYKKGAEKEFYKNAILIVATFGEEYIRQEMLKIYSEIDLLRSKKSPDDMCKNNDKIDAEIKRLKSKYKMFNYLLC